MDGNIIQTILPYSQLKDNRRSDMKSLLKVIKTLATHRVTYRFLAVLLGALGVAHSDQLTEGLETIVCSLAGSCS